VTKEFLAAEVLKVRVLDPAQEDFLVRQVVDMLQDCHARHQSCRQRRLAGVIRVDLAELDADQPPVDLPAEPHQLVVHVDDLIEPRPKQIFLPSRLLARPHRHLPR
jgi:hypothetical protein